MFKNDCRKLICLASSILGLILVGLGVYLLVSGLGYYYYRYNCGGSCLACVKQCDKMHKSSLLILSASIDYIDIPHYCRNYKSVTGRHSYRINFYRAGCYKHYSDCVVPVHKLMLCNRS
jgi:hypothetical protein